MTDYDEERRSELEVLESIFPDELTIISPSALSVRLTPEDSPSSSTATAEPLVLSLLITYSDKYPDELPEIGVRVEEGDLSEEEEESLVMGLIGAANDSLGMAMVYTLTSYLRESMAALLVQRKEAIAQVEADKSRREEEEQAKRVQGTKVTRESFNAWKVKFEKEMKEKAAKEEQERLRALPPKEREEVKKQLAKPSGRQLFEQDASLSKADEGDDDGVSVDVSKYERREGLSDSDDDDDGRGVLGTQELSDSD